MILRENLYSLNHLNEPNTTNDHFKIKKFIFKKKILLIIVNKKFLALSKIFVNVSCSLVN